MGIRIGIVGAGTTVAIADRHVEGFLAQARGAVPSPPYAAAPGGLPAAVYPARA